MSETTETTEGFEPKEEDDSLAWINQEGILPNLSVDKFQELYLSETRHSKASVHAQLQLTALEVNHAIKDWFKNQESFTMFQEIFYKNACFYLCRSKLELLFTSTQPAKNLDDQLEDRVSISKPAYEEAALKYLWHLTEGAVSSLPTGQAGKSLGRVALI